MVFFIEKPGGEWWPQIENGYIIPHISIPGKEAISIVIINSNGVRRFKKRKIEPHLQLFGEETGHISICSLQAHYSGQKNQIDD
jgi:hypothetical protein